MSSPVSAGDYFQSSPWVGETTYMDKTTHKLGFGLMNLLTGWSAFFFEPGREENHFFEGIGKGILYAITDTAGGALHVVTFPVPFDIPLPLGGINHEYES